MMLIYQQTTDEQARELAQLMADDTGKHTFAVYDTDRLLSIDTEEHLQYYDRSPFLWARPTEAVR